MQIHAELADRYGRIPRSVENLFDYGRLRKQAERMAIVSIDKTADGVAIKLGNAARISPEKHSGGRSLTAASCIVTFQRSED